MERINFSNINSVWASVLVETFWRLGIRTAVVCPGSRSAPLAVAIAQHGDIDAIPVLDERSAAFFALGLARQQRQPVLLVCTSGTAGANFYPAVIEAHESRVPLLVLTADRPPELRECNAGQTIDQQKLYGTYPNWYSELTVPAPDLALLSYLRQTLIHAWERSLFPVPGPVHLNLPFRDPLAPIPHPNGEAIAAEFDAEHFFAQVQPTTALIQQSIALPKLDLGERKGIIIAGPAQPQSPQDYCAAIAQLSSYYGFPVLAEGLSPLRNYARLNPNLISTYDLILRNAEWSRQLAPEVIIRVGDTSTSKELRRWLEQIQPLQWVVDEGDRNLNPLHLRTRHLRLTVKQLADSLCDLPAQSVHADYVQNWQQREREMRQVCDRALANTEDLFEGKVSWLLSQHLPDGTPLFVSNSMPVRDVEWFWQPGDRRIQPYFNRGANGIDGTLSTALGIAHRNQSSVLLTGDMALLHDTNGMLLRNAIAGHLTIVLVNNDGGGIFEMLPIAQFDPPFEAFFATPQNVDFAPLCAAYGIKYERITDWQHLIQRINPLPAQGIRLLEIRCDRKFDARWRQNHFRQWSGLSRP